MVPNFRVLLTDPAETMGFGKLAFRVAGAAACDSFRGRHFGAVHLGKARCELWHDLPRAKLPLVQNRSDMYDVALFDLWADHRDRRQFIFRRAERGWSYRAFAVDHGDLFGGPYWRSDNVETSLLSWCTETRGQVDRYLLSRIEYLQNLIPPLLSEAFHQMPCEWHDGDVNAFQVRYLSRLSLLESICRGPIVKWSCIAPIQLPSCVQERDRQREKSLQAACCSELAVER